MNLRRPQRHLIHLYGTVHPNSRATFVSLKLNFPYTLDEITLRFPADCAHLVQLYTLISLDPSAPTDAIPGGNNVLSPTSPNPYIAGDAEDFRLDIDLDIPFRPTWLKLHVYNTDTFQHSPSAIISITELLEEP